jgi:hypothetical protein
LFSFFFFLSFLFFFLLGPSSGFYSKRMHALWQAHGNGWRALWWWGNQPRYMPLIAAPPLPFFTVEIVAWRQWAVCSNS